MEVLALLAVPAFMRKLPTAPLPQESLRTLLHASLSLRAHSLLTLTLAGFQGLCSCSPPSSCISVFLVIKYPPWRLAGALWFCLRKGSRGFPFEVPHFFFSTLTSAVPSNQGMTGDLSSTNQKEGFSRVLQNRPQNAVYKEGFENSQLDLGSKVLSHTQWWYFEKKGEKQDTLSLINCWEVLK